MSRIDTSTQFANTKARIENSASKSSVGNSPGIAHVRNTFAVRAKEAQSKDKSRKLNKLASALDVLDIDFEAFATRNNHDMIDEIKSLLVIVKEHKKEEDDDVISLCDLMLSEHLRRLISIPNVSSTDGLWKVSN